jgi:hypothetical protein
MATDSARRSRDAIVEVLDAYGVKYWEGQKGTGTIASIEFHGGGTVQRILYAGGDQHGAQKARTATRRKLETLGFQRPLDPEPPLEPQIVEQPSEPQIIEQPSEPIPLPAPPSAVDHIDHPPRFTDGGYVVYQHSQYHIPNLPVGYIAIHCPDGLLVEQGNFLCIPLHAKDQAWSITPDEYRRHFIPQTQTAAIMPQDAPLEEPPSEAPSVETKVDIPEIEQPPAVSFPVVQTEETTPFRRLVGPFSRRAKITPQIGRVLVALYNVHHTGRTEISAKGLRSFMQQPDKLQVATSLSYSVRHHLVEKTKGDTVYEWRLTEEGTKAVQQIGTWPWDDRRLARPKWLRLLVEEEA